MSGRRMRAMLPDFTHMYIFFLRTSLLPIQSAIPSENHMLKSRKFFDVMSVNWCIPSCAMNGFVKEGW